MKKTLAALLLLITSLASAQTFDADAAAAHAAVSQLDIAAEARVAADSAQIAGLNADKTALQSSLTSAQAQIQALQSTKIYRDLEWLTWGMNCNAQVGGSGNGIGSQSPAPSATFSIVPTPPAVGTANYFDCYYTADAAPDDAKTHFSLTLPWKFPTQADANASQALEMEIRQSLSNGLMAVWALQMNFSGKQLRIWDHQHAWFSSGTAQARLTPGVTYAVTIEGHRDAVNACYDAITINATRTTLSYCYPMWNMGWRPMMRVAAQLDGNGAGTAYKVSRSTTEFRSW